MEGDGGVRQDGKGKTKGKMPEKGKGKAGDKPKEVAVVVVDDYNARAIRHALRVFVATGAGMKAWEAVSARFMGGNKKDQVGTTKEQKPSALRLSLSLSSILLLYRLLFRFLTRLRVHLLDPSATLFRVRNPRTAATLTSPYAPAVGASLAGLALGVYPSQQLRVSVAIYTMFRALEFGWNCAEENGMVWGWEKGVGGRPDKKRARPAWWGSWMLQPFAFGQLLHAVVFDRDCFPAVSLSSREKRGLLVADKDTVVWRPHLQELVCLSPNQTGRLPPQHQVAQDLRDCRLPRRDGPSQLAVRLPPPSRLSPPFPH